MHLTIIYSIMNKSVVFAKKSSKMAVSYFTFCYIQFSYFTNQIKEAY